jgi:mannosyltransferase
MKIYLDNIVFDLQQMGGISVYFAELIARLLSDGIDVRFVERRSTRLNNVRANLQIPDRSIEAERGLRIFERHRPIRLALDDRAIVHSSYYRTCYHRDAVNVVTVYDFVYEHFRSGIPRYVHSRAKRKALDNADGIVCISESTRADLLRFHGDIDPTKVAVIHLGASGMFAPVQLRITGASTPGIPVAGEFVLYVGSRAAYKNFLIAVEAVSKVAATKLVIVGGGELSPHEKRALEAGVAGRYVVLRNVTAHALNDLYNSALCLLYPSSYEGFGLPVLEAMQAGCPVIAARRSSIPEVAGNTCLLVDAIDAETIAANIVALKDSALRAGLIRAGIERARLFSWDRMFRETLLFYAKTMSRKG